MKGAIIKKFKKRNAKAATTGVHVYSLFFENSSEVKSVGVFEKYVGQMATTTSFAYF